MILCSVDIFGQYIGLGFTHVIPLGFDHILFILSLYLYTTSFSKVLIQCSVFTIAHSFSMALAALDIIIPNPDYVEPLIAITILYTSIENIIQYQTNNFRLIVVFLFGIIHGLGFASVLNEIGLPSSGFILALFSFNLGVEIGQAFVLLLFYFLVVKWFKDKSWYQKWIVYPVSSLIGCYALYLAISRIIGVF